MSTFPPSKSFPDTPAFFVGVTGFMDLQHDPFLTERFKCLLRFLRHGPRCGRPRPLDLLLTDLAPPGCAKESAKLYKVYRQALGGWPGLKNTPIVVMCGLAPGADTFKTTQNSARRTDFISGRPCPFHMIFIARQRPLSKMALTIRMTR
jgi:hypothetical protein